MKKIIILGVIALFVGVGFQPAFAVEPKLSTDNIEKVEDFKFQEISRDDFFKIKDLLSELKDFTNSVMTRFGHIPEVKEKCQELLDVINEYRPICLFTALTILYILGFIVIFAILAVEAGEGTLIYYIYYIIGKNWVNRYNRWIGLYEDVLECGEFLPDAELGYELGKIFEIKQIVSING